MQIRVGYELIYVGIRYCETDCLSETAWRLFEQTALGRRRVQAICDFGHRHIQFDYLQARVTRTALEAFRERIGRVLIAQGRDAADVPLSTAFGPNLLKGFKVWTEEQKPHG